MPSTHYRDQFLDDAVAEFADVMTPEQLADFRGRMTNTLGYAIAQYCDAWYDIAQSLGMFWLLERLISFTCLIFGHRPLPMLDCEGEQFGEACGRCGVKL